MAKRRLKDHDSVEFILGDMISIPLENESVDFVMCRDSLFHSPDEIRSVGEIYRVLKKMVISILPPVTGAGFSGSL